MITEAIAKIVSKEDLSFDEAYRVIDEIMQGKTTQTQNAAFLAALCAKSAKAETIDEISGCASAMRSHAICVETPFDLMDIVGTGGDNSQSFNISTTAAFILSAGGVKIAKHGNRGASSKSGSADCLEALGAKIELLPEKCINMLDKIGICFFYAPLYHKSMHNVADIRKELGFRTVFNILGPLTNPARPIMQLLGVYDEYLIHPLSQVLINLGIRRGMVVYGQDALDEISICAPTSICEIKDGWCKNYIITPELFGIERCTLDDLKGGSPDDNATITKDILLGKEKGHKTDAVLLNAGAALYIAGKVMNIKDGVTMAKDLISSGRAYRTLESFIEMSKS